MHPVIQVMSREPERWFTSMELRDAINSKGHSVLRGFVNRGVLVEAPDPRPGYPHGKKYRFNSLPKRSGAQPLNPPVFTHGKQLALFVANPEAWITQQDLRHYLNVPTGRKSLGVNTFELVRRGYVEAGKRNGVRAWRLKQLPPAGASPRPAPRPKARTTTKPDKTPAQLAQQIKRREEAQARRAARLAAQRKAIQQEEAGTYRRMEALMADGQPRTAKAIGEALNLQRGRLQKAVNQLVNDGLLVTCEGRPVMKYRMISPNLPAMPAKLTPAAKRTQQQLTGRAETELGLSAALSAPRDDVRRALGNLHALNRLEWRAVGNLFIYRLKEEARETLTD